MTQFSEPNADGSDLNAILDIPTLRKEGKTCPFRLTMSFDALSVPIASHAPFNVEGEVRFNSTGFEVIGTVKGHIQQICDRCANDYQRDIEESFHENFAYEELINPKGSGEFELLADDFYETHASDEPFDLKRLIEELLIITLSYDRYCYDNDCVTAGN